MSKVFSIVQLLLICRLVYFTHSLNPNRFIFETSTLDLFYWSITYYSMNTVCSWHEPLLNVDSQIAYRLAAISWFCCRSISFIALATLLIESGGVNYDTFAKSPAAQMFCPSAYFIAVYSANIALATRHWLQEMASSTEEIMGSTAGCLVFTANVLQL